MESASLTRSRHGRLAAFLAETDGGGTIWSMFFFVLFMTIGGLALDFANGESARNHMQATADAAALAAAMDLPDTAAATVTALDYANRNAPSGRFGAVIEAADIEFGTWDNATRTFTVSGATPGAVRVTARRRDDRLNGVTTFLLRFVGVGTLEVNARSIARVTPPACSSGGLFTAAKVYSGSNNGYIDKFCLHGALGVKIGSDNSFEDGVIVSMDDLATFVQSSNNSGIDDALREDTHDVTLPAMVPGIVSSMQAGNLSGLPGYITEGPVYLSNITSSTVLTPNTLYIVNDVADLGSNRTVENIAIVAVKEVKTGSNVILRNVVLATNDKILFGSSNDFGSSNYCDSGNYSVYAFAGDNIEFGSESLIRGTQLVTRKMLKLGSTLRGLQGVYGEALEDIDYGSADVFGGCPGGLTSGVGDTAINAGSGLVN